MSSEQVPAASKGLSRKVGAPLHHQLYLILYGRILSGQYPAGDPLPTEEILSEKFCVSRATARQALATLEGQGLIDRRQGVGTFVKDHAHIAQVHVPMANLQTHISAVDRDTKIHLLELIYCTAPQHVQKMFKCGAQQIFQRAHRLRLAGEVPIFHFTTFIPEDIAKRFSESEISSVSFKRLFERAGYSYDSGVQSISAVLADPEMALALHVKVGAPLLQVRTLYLDQRKRPIEYMEVLASSGKFEVQMTLDAAQLTSAASPAGS